MGIRPWEFRRLTPAETAETVAAWADVETRRERETWRRFAFLAAHVINVSGKVSKRTVKPEQLISLDGERRRLGPEEMERRRREAAETLRQHKAKFWTKFKDESVARITGETDER